MGQSDGDAAIRIRMVIRENALSVLGGDTVQMQQTARALRALNFIVEESCGFPTDDEVRACDIVHAFNLQTPEFTLAAVEQAKRLGKPVAISTIFWDFGADKLIQNSPKWRLISQVAGRRMARSLAQKRVESASRMDRNKLKSILAGTDVWLPNSNAEADQLRRLSNTVKPCHPVPNGVDPARFDVARRLPFPKVLADRGLQSKTYLLIAARLDPDKNQLGFLQAVAEAKIPVVLCGPSPDPEYLDACRQYCPNILESAHGDDLDALMWHAKVHALPSFRETPGLSNLEAAALGCNIVSTVVGSTREYFGTDVNYCEPWSASSMRHAVQRAWDVETDPKFSQLVRTRFTWDAAAGKTAAAYREILQQ